MEKVSEQVVVYEKGWWYFLGKDGCVWRKPETRGRRKVSDKPVSQVVVA